MNWGKAEKWKPHGGDNSVSVRRRTPTNRAMLVVLKDPEEQPGDLNGNGDCHWCTHRVPFFIYSH